MVIETINEKKQLYDMLVGEFIMRRWVFQSYNKAYGGCGSRKYS